MERSKRNNEFIRCFRNSAQAYHLAQAAKHSEEAVDILNGSLGQGMLAEVVKAHSKRMKKIHKVSEWKDVPQVGKEIVTLFIGLSQASGNLP